MQSLLLGNSSYLLQALEDYDRDFDDGYQDQAYPDFLSYNSDTNKISGGFDSRCFIVRETEKAVCFTGIANCLNTKQSYLFIEEWFPKTGIISNPPLIKKWTWDSKATDDKLLNMNNSEKYDKTRNDRSVENI